MAYKAIYIWVEGDDDERLLKDKIEPELFGKYDHIKFLKWAKLRKVYIRSFIESINSMGADYIFLRDFDFSPCISNRKEKTKNVYSFLETDRICIVVKEIEGWYLAGLNEEASKKLRIKNFVNTTTITKEKFDGIIPQNFDSRSLSDYIIG